MKLASVISVPPDKPLRILIYGVDGIGKTTFAANAPDPVFVGVEDGLARLHVPRFPEPGSWLDVLAAVDELTHGDHNYRTLAIDSMDWLEPLCWAHVCFGKRTKQGNPIESIEDFPYGKGYNAALDEWRVLLAKLDHLRSKRGMWMILVAHSWIRTFRNPLGDDFDRHTIKLHEKTIAPLLREWCDIVLFATHEQYTHDLNGRAKGIATGARIIHTVRAAGYDAKNRHDLPPTLPLDWQAFSDALTAGQPGEPATILARITAELERFEGDMPKLAEHVRRSLAAAGDDAAELARIHNKLIAQLSIKNRQELGT